MWGTYVRWKREILFQIGIDNIMREFRSLFCLFLKQTGCGKWCAYSGMYGFGLWLLYGERIHGRTFEEIVSQYFFGYTGSLIYMAAYVILAMLPVISTIFFLKRGICEEYYYSRVTNRSSVALAKTSVIGILVALIEGSQLLSLLTVLFANNIIYLNASTAITFFKIMMRLTIPRISLSLLLYLWIKLLWEPVIFCSVAVLLVTLEPICRQCCRVFYFSSLDISQLKHGALLRNIMLIFLIVVLIIMLDRSANIISEGDLEKNGSG